VRVSSGRCHAVPSSRIASSGARRFEAGQPGVTIVTPGRPGDRWRAVLPLGVLPDDGTTISAVAVRPDGPARPALPGDRSASSRSLDCRRAGGPKARCFVLFGCHGQPSFQPARHVPGPGRARQLAGRATGAGIQATARRSRRLGPNPATGRPGRGPRARKRAGRGSPAVKSARRTRSGGRGAVGRRPGCPCRRSGGRGRRGGGRGAWRL
jgi:hypothetical protein